MSCSEIDSDIDSEYQDDEENSDSDIEYQPDEKLIYVENCQSILRRLQLYCEEQNLCICEDLKIADIFELLEK